jgi:hypothetical protein
VAQLLHGSLHFCRCWACLACWHCLVLLLLLLLVLARRAGVLVLWRCRCA